MKIKKIIYKIIEEKFLKGCSDYNPLSVRRASRSKKQARNVFKEHNIPHAKGIIFLNPYTAYKFVKKHGFPVCIKPNIGGRSRGSFFPINTWKEFWKACFFVKIWWPTSVIEKYLLGKNYRVLVTKTGGIEAIMQRYPAFVVGDGKSTIDQLINIENKIREEMDILNVIQKIKKNQELTRNIKEYGFTLSSVLEKDKKLYFNYKNTLNTGGVLKNIDIISVPDKNKELFLDILKIFDSNIFGLDVIMVKGIEYDYDKQECIFLEVNSRPFLKIHDVPRFGTKHDMTDMFLRLNSIDVKDRGFF